MPDDYILEMQRRQAEDADRRARENMQRAIDENIRWTACSFWRPVPAGGAEAF